MSNEHVAVHGGQRPASVPGAGASANECDLSCRSAIAAARCPRCGCDGSSSVGGIEYRDDDVWTSSFCCVDSWAIENGPSDSGWAY